MDKDERGLFEAMLHRLQIMRQESEQQTALLRQLCQAMDGLGQEVGRLTTAIENSGATESGATSARGRRSAGVSHGAVGGLSAQAALAKDLLARSQAGTLNASGKSLGK